MIVFCSCSRMQITTLKETNRGVFLSRHRFKIVSFFHKIYIKPLHTFETSYFSSVIVKSLAFSNREMYRYSFQYGSNGICLVHHTS